MAPLQKTHALRYLMLCVGQKRLTFSVACISSILLIHVRSYYLETFVRVKVTVCRWRCTDVLSLVKKIAMKRRCRPNTTKNVQSLQLPPELVINVSQSIFTITALMSWYSCCRMHWQLYVDGNREQWLQQLVEKHNVLNRLVLASPQVQFCRDFVLMKYAIQATKLCMAIEGKLTRLLEDWVASCNLREPTVLPAGRLDISKSVKLSDYMKIPEWLESSEIRLLTQCRLFIQHRYGWTLSLEDAKQTYLFPWKHAKIDDKETLGLALLAWPEDVTIQCTK